MFCEIAALHYTLMAVSVALALASVAMLATRHRDCTRVSRYKAGIQAHVALVGTFGAVSQACISDTVRTLFGVSAALVRTEAIFLSELYWLDLATTLGASLRLERHADRRDVRIAAVVLASVMALYWVGFAALLVVELVTPLSLVDTALQVSSLAMAAVVLVATPVLWVRILGLLRRLETHMASVGQPQRLAKVVAFGHRSAIAYATYAILTGINVALVSAWLATGTAWLKPATETVATVAGVCILLFAL